MEKTIKRNEEQQRKFKN